MSKTRVYELAREFGIDNREVLARIGAVGIQVRNHMSSLEPEEVERVKRAIEKDKQQNIVEERIRPTVVRRRVMGRPKPEEVPVSAPPPAATLVSAETRVISRAPEKPKIEGEAAPSIPAKAPVAKAAVEPHKAVTPPPPAKPAAPQTPLPPAKTPPPPPVATRDEVPEAQPRSEHKKPPVVEAEPVLQITEQEPAAPAVAEFSAPEPMSESAVEVIEPEPETEEESQPTPGRVSRPSQPPSYEERLGSAALPPGVVARGKQVASVIGRLSPEERSRIVSQHAEQRRALESGSASAAAGTAPPRRRELARAAIGPVGRPQVRPGRAKKQVPGKKAKKTELTVPSAQKRVIRIEDQVGVQTLAQRMSMKATDLLMRLMQLGMTGVMINSTLDADTAKIVASEFGFEVENVAVSYDDFIQEARGKYLDQEGDRELRPPVVTVMGHVDHGKTSLLDKVRKTNVVATESGGITQHLGAYRVDTRKGTLVFLDTPGHAAFTAMRARGAKATDIVILVVAADDGVMEQTKEAINHSKAAKVPIVVAINKIDKPTARPDTIKRDLANLGLQPEEWGGDTIFVNVSAITGEGIDKLLESVAIQAEVLELKANANIPAQGVVLEAYLDKGRGPVANLLVQDGTLKTGNFLVAGMAFGKIRAMTDDRGKPSSKAGPATPVEVLGLSEVPEAGDTFDVVIDAKAAQQLAEKKRGSGGKVSTGATAGSGLDKLMQKMQEGETQELKLVVKADVQGSAEALGKALSELSGDKVKVHVIHSGVGAITESDVTLASASGAMLLGFRVRPTGSAVKVAKAERVEIRTYKIIYEVLDEMTLAMTGMLKPDLVEKQLGKAEVRQVFSLAKGKIAGCYVQEGKIVRSARLRLVRDSVQIWEGGIKSLRRVKDDVREVAAGLECGISLENYDDLKERDVLECFEVSETAATL
jgi:translation initiation factor IF-2